MQPEWSTLRILTSKPARKGHSGTPRCRWEDNVRMELEKIVINTRNWVDSAQDIDYWRAVINAAFNLRAL
jgi:hypothetical protein